VRAHGACSRCQAAYLSGRWGLLSVLTSACRCSLRFASLLHAGVPAAAPHVLVLMFCLLHSVCRLFRNTSELEKLSELGVLFLLFEMGLELSFDRLKARPQPRPMCLPLKLDLGLADLSLARSVADRAWGPL